jgi:hypothetical protein
MNQAYNATLAKASTLQLTPQELRVIRGHSAAYQKHLSHLARTAANASDARARGAANITLQSYSARLSAVIRSTRSEHERSITFAELCTRAASHTPRVAASETVRARMKPKPGGGERPVIDFGPGRRAFQLICSDILTASLPTSQFEFLRRGRGAEKMIQRILGGLESGEFDHVVSVDIRNCFGSIRKEVLYRLLPLPQWAVSTIITIDDQARIELQGPSSASRLALDEAARQGLPQGASTSGLILSRAILGPMLATTSFADRTYLYGDNIAVVARSWSDGEAILRALCSMLENSPAGPLTIGEHSIQCARQRLELVKYALLPIPARYGGGIRIIPSPKSRRRFEHRVTARSMEGQSIEEINLYSRQWASAFPLWRPNATSLQYLRNASMLAWMLGQSPCRTDV